MGEVRPPGRSPPRSAETPALRDRLGVAGASVPGRTTRHRRCARRVVDGQEAPRGARALHDRDRVGAGVRDHRLDVDPELARPEGRQMPIGLLVLRRRQHVARGLCGLGDGVAPMLHRHQAVAAERVRPARDIPGGVDVGAGRAVGAQDATGAVAGHAARIRHQARIRQPVRGTRRTEGPRSRGRPRRRARPRAARGRPGPTRRPRSEAPVRRLEGDAGIPQAIHEHAADPGAEGTGASGVGLGSTRVTGSPRSRRSRTPPRSRSGRRRR